MWEVHEACTCKCELAHFNINHTLHSAASKPYITHGMIGYSLINTNQCNVSVSTRAKRQGPPVQSVDYYQYRYPLNLLTTFQEHLHSDNPPTRQGGGKRGTPPWAAQTGGWETAHYRKQNSLLSLSEDLQGGRARPLAELRRGIEASGLANRKSAGNNDFSASSAAYYRGTIELRSPDCLEFCFKRAWAQENVSSGQRGTIVPNGQAVKLKVV